MLRLIIIIFSAMILSGCGQYGALYLPNGKQTPSSSAYQKNNDVAAPSTIQEETE